MSQYGGGRPGGAAWNRPPTGAPMPGFPGLGGVSGLPLGMGVQMGQMGGMSGVQLGMVNQAAFQQPNMINMAGMGMMGAMPTQQVPRPGPQAANGTAVSAAAATGGQVNAQQRTFIGTVTKMHESYGFVDDDVFFQHSVIRGAHPRIGDRVMVEAVFNPAMPFKWNAKCIQVLNKTVQPAAQNSAILNAQSLAASATNRSPPNAISARPVVASRWGDSAAASSAVRTHSRSPKRTSSPSRRHSPRRGSSPKRSPARRRTRSRSRSLRRSPPPVRRPSPPGRAESASRQADRKRERSPAASTHSGAGVRRESASPPRRRARIIPRYEFRSIKAIPLGELQSVGALKSRYPKLYIPSDFVDMTADWVKRVPLDSTIDMTNPVAFHVWHKDVEAPNDEDEPEPILDPEDADHKYQVKVLLFSHAGRTEFQKKAFCLLPDGSTDDKEEPSNPFKQLQFLVGMKGKETLALGGSWSPSLDGADPNDPTTVIKTAIRTTKALTGVDLSNVPQWYQLGTLRYYRAEKDRCDVVRLLFPDTQLLMPADDDEWTCLLSAIKAQLDTKLANIEKLTVPPPPKPETAKEKAEEPTENGAEKKEEEPKAAESAKDSTPAAEVKKGDEEKKVESEKEKTEDKPADVSMQSEGGNEAEKDASGKSHWSKLDPKSLKVAELRTELEARGLETKGIKTLLVQRLTDAIEKEKEEEQKNSDEPMDTSQLIETDSTDVKKEDSNSTTDAEKKAQEKSEAEKKKADEEYKKKIEKLEKEKKEKKETLERHFAPPKDKKVFVFPSKTFKGGKFDCKVMTLQALLDYRNDDNKESQFEVSVFAEAFRELLERLAAFQIYKSIVEAGDKEVEKKKRDDARKVNKQEDKESEEEKKDEENGDGKKEDGKDDKSDAKKKDSKKDKERDERIELKSVVHHRQVYEAYALFDLNLCSYLMTRDVEEILYNGEFGVSRGQMSKLIHKLIVRDKLNYRHLTDVLTDMDGNMRHTPGQADSVPSLENLIRGFGYKAAEQGIGGASKEMSTSSDGTVVINGNVVNVAMKLALLKKAEAERDTAKTSLTEQQSLVAQLRDSKSEIEKKKRDLEKDYDKVKKKLNESNSALKNSMDDSASIRNALLDCKKYGERLVSVVDKVFPPSPKKDSKKEDKENGKGDEKKKEDKEKSKEGEQSASSAANEVVVPDDDSAENEKTNGTTADKPVKTETESEMKEAAQTEAAPTSNEKADQKTPVEDNQTTA
ncbi:hypothetical protein WR25_03043 [Diploscapter pachys]|uniref:SAP domain-containing protein n=1 Tax=Diploscapter pachys TaxID=2018661 RepID=A0A2A2K8S6_9BILA|nr:hypothetical protein WR25_03043 [Diploscapter pachys]